MVPLVNFLRGFRKMGWKIRPIIAGKIYGDYSFNVSGMHMGKKGWVPSFIWYITDGKKKILVDTGFGDPDFVARHQSLFKVKAQKSLEDLLFDLNIKPESINTVVFTHLHWDHCGTAGIFKNAEFYIQRDEICFALAPPDFTAVAFHSPSIGIEPEWLRTQFQLIDGDIKIESGITLVKTPGHTPGHQSLIIETEGKKYGIAGDLFPLYINIKGLPGMKFLPPYCINYIDWYYSARKFSSMCDIILPSHDSSLSEEWIE